MKCVAILRTVDGFPSQADEETQLTAGIRQYDDALARAGVLLATEQLRSGPVEALIRHSGDYCSVVNGDFAKELDSIAAFWVWRVRSREEAVEWARRFPNPAHAQTTMEIRAVPKIH